MAGLQWRIIDSTWVPWDELTDSIQVFAIAVTNGANVDTVADVTWPLPIGVNDSTVIGLRILRSATKTEFFRVSGPLLVETTFALPPDVHSIFSEIAISPDGQYVGYVGADSGALPYAVVRRFPSGPELARGPTTSGCDCDVDLNHARWLSADSFEIAVVDAVAGKGWQVVSGNAAAGRTHVRAAATEPAWHE